MMTASVVDDLTDTPSSKNRECTGLGLANAAASLFGGIAGCGMDQMTQQNAAMVEETTAASRTLADESTQLKTLLSNFRLRGAEQRAGARYTRAA